MWNVLNVVPNRTMHEVLRVAGVPRSENMCFWGSSVVCCNIIITTLLILMPIYSNIKKTGDVGRFDLCIFHLCQIA